MAYELQDFNNDVVIQSKTTPVVIDFWAEWCGPCKILTPILEKLAAEAAGRWNLVKINTEQYRQIAAQFGIRSIPSVKMVYQGAIIAEFQGAIPEAAVRKWLKENLPGNDDEDEETNLLDELLQSGDRDRARSVLQQHPGNSRDPGMRVKLAMLSLPDHIKEAETLMANINGEAGFGIEHESLQTIKHLRDVHDGVIPVKEDTPAGSSYIRGTRALFGNDFETAIESFLDTLVRDRKLDNDGARKALIAVFTILTDKHPLSVKYRRQFSMALY